MIWTRERRQVNRQHRRRSRRDMMKKKPAITITTTILVSVLGAGLAWAQSPRIIQNTRDTMNGVSNHQTAASNQALGVQERAPSAASATRAAKKASATTAKKPATVAPKAHAAASIRVRWKQEAAPLETWRGCFSRRSVAGDSPAAGAPEEQPVDTAASADAAAGRCAEAGEGAASDGSFRTVSTPRTADGILSLVRW
jgi:cytoskeletal protein RodZ